LPGIGAYSGQFEANIRLLAALSAVSWTNDTIGERVEGDFYMSMVALVPLELIIEQ
jgi:hypothetical protein